jgi:hypothetical protein
MRGIADPVPRGNSLGFSQLEQFFGHQPRWPPLVGRNASVEVAVLWLEAYLALASLAGSLCHDMIPHMVEGGASSTLGQGTADMRRPGTAERSTVPPVALLPVRPALQSPTSKPAGSAGGAISPADRLPDTACHSSSPFESPRYSGCPHLLRPAAIGVTGPHVFRPIAIAQEHDSLAVRRIPGL